VFGIYCEPDGEPPGRLQGGSCLEEPGCLGRYCSGMRRDGELVAAVLAGEREAFADLVRRYEHAVRAVAMGVLRDHHAAQDVAQEAFVAAYQRLDTLRDRSAFATWLLAITRNQALGHLRQGRHHESLDSLRDVPGHPGNGELDARAERLLFAVTALPEHERTVVLLRYFVGHSLQEIAEISGTPVGTIGAQLHRARTHLRERLGGATNET